MKRFRIVVWAFLFVSPFNLLRAVDRKNSEAKLRAVAEYVIAQTSYQLCDFETGQRFDSSEGLPIKSSIGYHSHFNGWYYQNWLVIQGMDALGKELGEARYKGYKEKNLQFVLQHLPYFDEQYRQNKMPRPKGESSTSRISYYYYLSLPWMSGLAPLWIEQARTSRDNRYLDYLHRFDSFIAHHRRDSLGLFVTEGAVRTDDPALTIPAMLQLYRYKKDKRYLDDAVNQLIRSHERLFDSHDALYYHGWDYHSKQCYSNYWGRGNGWMGIAFVALLEALPAGYPRRKELLSNYRSFAEGLKQQSAHSGGWRQVINRPEAWVETSATGLLIYTLARGVRNRWIDRSYEQVVLNAWNTLCQKVDDQGTILDTCPSTHHSNDVDYYLNRKRNSNDSHAFGTFLMAGAEVLHLVK